MGGENEADRLARHDGLQKLLAETFELPVRLYPASDYAGVLQALAARQIEIASLGPAAYASAWIDTAGGVEPLLVNAQSDGSISYVSVMVVRADSNIDSLEKMRGRSIAWADPNSASGYLIPRFQLRREGIDPEPGRYFSRSGFGGGHEQAVIAMLQGQYDACVTNASGQGDPALGYSRGNLRSMVDKGMLDMQKVRIIWISSPILTGPLAVRSDLPAALKDDLKRFYRALPTAYPEIYRQISRGDGAGYRDVRHEDYELFVEMRRQEAQERRRR